MLREFFSQIFDPLTPIFMETSMEFSYTDFVEDSAKACELTNAM